MQDQCLTKDSVKLERRKHSSDLISTLKPVLPPTLLRAMELAQEKGSSSYICPSLGTMWSNLQQRSVPALRYGWTPANSPTHCACGTGMSVEHALSCPMGGLPIVNTMRLEIL